MDFQIQALCLLIYDEKISFVNLFIEIRGDYDPP